MPTILKKRLFNQRGITLIELIAVILIIGIIAAVGIPVVFNQIKDAETKTDAANLTIINDALERYATMNNGYPAETAVKAGGNPIFADLKAFLASSNNHGPYIRSDFSDAPKHGTWSVTVTSGKVTGVTNP